MPNLLQELQEMVGEDDLIVAICIGQKDDWRNENEWPYPPEGWAGTLREWSPETRAFLDHDYDDGYGGAEIPPFCLWTQTRIIFPDVYDGATSICSAPRNPTPDSALMPGGG